MDHIMPLNEQDSYNFFINGFIHGHIDEIESINFDEYTFFDVTQNAESTEPIDQKVLPILNQVCDIVKDRFVGQLFKNFKLHEMTMWQGVDAGSSQWHNDFEDYKAYNSNVLVYLDDSYEKNTIEVRNGTETFVMYPKKGDLVWLNQNKKFEHRASHICGKRRLMCFEFYIDDLWTS